MTEHRIAEDSAVNRWSTERVTRWFADRPWLVGCNFIPSTAINQLEMWQADTFDPSTIERELGWAADLGFNAVRVYLHDLLWESGEDGFLQRVNEYLGIADHLGIATLFVIFDDCWNPTAQLGRQPEPVPGVHNSGWVQSPGDSLVDDQRQWPRLERYVKGLLTALSRDQRILGWDLYNEPSNKGKGERSLPLLKKVFAWAREIDPSQPLTCGLWNPEASSFNAYQVAASDFISFHHYEGAESLATWLPRLQAYGRPLACTEYLNRHTGSMFDTHLPVFKRERIPCFSWGLVSGKTQTIWPWGSPAGAAEPRVWFHDIFRNDHTSYDPAEVAFIRSMTGRAGYRRAP